MIVEVVIIQLLAEDQYYIGTTTIITAVKLLPLPLLHLLLENIIDLRRTMLMISVM